MPLSLGLDGMTATRKRARAIICCKACKKNLGPHSVITDEMSHKWHHLIRTEMRQRWNGNHLNAHPQLLQRR